MYCVSTERFRSAPGFTLIEVAMCVVIVGIGSVALMQFMGSATSVNRANADSALAIEYAKSGWEVAVSQGYDAVSGWSSQTPSSAPALMTFGGGQYKRIMWSEYLDINNIAGASNNPPTPALDTDGNKRLRLNVEIWKGSAKLCAQQWIMTNP